MKRVLLIIFVFLSIGVLISVGLNIAAQLVNFPEAHVVARTVNAIDYTSVFPVPLLLGVLTALLWVIVNFVVFLGLVLVGAVIRGIKPRSQFALFELYTMWLVVLVGLYFGDFNVFAVVLFSTALPFTLWTFGPRMLKH